MTNQSTVFVLDAGNTTIKVGVFKNNELTQVQRFESSNHELLRDWKNEIDDAPCVLSSVLSVKQTNQLASFFKHCLIVQHSTPFPLEFAYKTPETLGIDRICNAVAVSQASPQKNVVSIDIGTCIKFDFVDAKGIYQGGSIAPGIHLRYKSLNDYTANLPLLNATNKTPLIGQSTAESIQSGVINGIQAEISHIIQRYSLEFDDLTFFMTGGDSHYFDIPRKNNIFVDENLTLKGLYQIYLFNAL